MNLLDSLPDKTLSLPEESRLCKTPEGRTDLVLHSMREAFFYGKGVSRGKLPDDEIFSLCYTALTNAVKNYNPSKNRRFAKSRFFGYAKPYIRGEVYRTWGRSSVVTNGKCISFHDGTDEVGEFQGENNKTRMVSNVIPATDFVEPDFDRIDIKERWELIAPLIVRVLSDTEKMIVDLHYRGGFNFQELGKLLEISRSAIQNSHSRALKKIRVALFESGNYTTNK